MLPHGLDSNVTQLLANLLTSPSVFYYFPIVSCNLGSIKLLLYCLSWLSAWCRFVLDDLWNAVVCFQPPSLLIGKILVPVMHFCACFIHCRVYWRVGRRLRSCRLISVQPLTGSTIWVYSISSCSVGIGGSVLSILREFPPNRSQHVMVYGCRSKLVNVDQSAAG